MKNQSKIQIVCQNRKATHEYFINESMECGIVLVGSEIKSIRNHKVSLDGSYCTITNNEMWLINANIDQYKQEIYNQHDPKRKRKLLLNATEIRNFGKKSEQKGFTLIPLSIYLSNGVAKVKVAICKGKAKSDKRESDKEKTAIKDMKRFVKK